MKDQIVAYAKKWLEDGRGAGFLALKKDGRHVRPHLFTDPAELDALSLGDEHGVGTERYPLVKILMRLHHRHPTETFAVMVRGCEERALQKLAQASQIALHRIQTVGFCCPGELAERCGCLKPYPEDPVAGTKPEVPPSSKVVTATPRNLVRDMGFLKEQFERCIKCYGCRNVCPVCFCKECTLEEDTFVPRTGTSLPPPNPEFLLTRAVHMVGYCVYCGLCEEACPADIPLKTVYKMVANIINESQGAWIQGVPERGRPPAEESEREEKRATG